MKIQHAEESVYPAVESGEIEILPDGTIWRVRKRWNGVSWPCLPVRAEHAAGPYFQVRVMFDRVRYCACAHRLVYRHFKGPIPQGITINHKDGNKRRDHPINLELATYSDQQLHAIHVLRTSRMAHQDGALNAMAKLTLPEVEEICRRRGNGEPLRSIATDFNVSDRTISKIALCRRWQRFRRTA